MFRMFCSYHEKVHLFVCRICLLALMKKNVFEPLLASRKHGWPFKKKSEFGVNELDISLKFHSGISGLQVLTLNGRAGALWRQSGVWDIMDLEIRLGLES